MTDPSRYCLPDATEVAVKDSWAVIATYWSLVEAKMASALLASEHIPSRLADEGITGAHPLLAIAVGGVRLLVAPEGAQKARTVLELRGLLPSGGPPPVDPGSLEEEAIEAAPADESVRDFLRARRKPQG
jgi:Putative prokaryotic signal transducing protein